VISLRHRPPGQTPFSGLLRQTKRKTVTVVTDGRDDRGNNDNRHDFAVRNAEKLVVGAVAGHHTLGPGWHCDAARLRSWFEMPCPDGASTSAGDSLRTPGNSVAGPTFHALLPVALGACPHSERRSSWLLRYGQSACTAVGFPGRLWRFHLLPVERQRPCGHNLRARTIRSCIPA
jgi:hypothetical protein